MLRLLYSAGFLELGQILAANLIGLVVIINFPPEGCAFSTVLPDEGKVVGGSRDLVFKPGSDDPFQGTGHGCEEIGRGLSVGADKPKVLKVGLGIGASAEVDLATFVQDQHLVKDLIWLVTSNHMVSTGRPTSYAV